MVSNGYISKESPPPSVAVIIATKGRPQAATRILRLLEKQTVLPAIVFFSASSEADVDASVKSSLSVKYVYGPAGSSAQRNRAMETVLAFADFIVFFDDDFAPSTTWIERCVEVFLSDSAVVGISGNVLLDGAGGTSVSWEEASLVIKDAEQLQCETVLTKLNGLYGCNMAFRVSAIGGVRFDERLVLYGWLEDLDFSRAISRKGKLVKCNCLIGVHLALRAGRVSGKRFGYSQIVNAWYLHKKGTLSRKEVWSNIFRALVVNSMKILRAEPHIDRRGRFVGNLIGLADILSGRCRPERAADL